MRSSVWWEMFHNFVCVSFVKHNRFVWSVARKGVSPWSNGKVIFIQVVHVSTVSIKKMITGAIFQISGFAEIFEWGRVRNLPNHNITCSYFKISRVFVIVACSRSHVTESVPVHPVSITFWSGWGPALLAGPLITHSTSSRRFEIVFVDSGYESPTSSIYVHITVHRILNVIGVYDVINSTSIVPLHFNDIFAACWQNIKILCNLQKMFIP